LIRLLLLVDVGRAHRGGDRGQLSQIGFVLAGKLARGPGDFLAVALILVLGLAVLATAKGHLERA
jgi:hypothetical protein